MLLEAADRRGLDTIRQLLYCGLTGRQAFAELDLDLIDPTEKRYLLLSDGDVKLFDLPLKFSHSLFDRGEAALHRQGCIACC